MVKIWDNAKFKIKFVAYLFVLSLRISLKSKRQYSNWIYEIREHIPPTSWLFMWEKLLLNHVRSSGTYSLRKIQPNSSCNSLKIDWLKKSLTFDRVKFR
jgi:hypothetical protein